VSVIPLKADIDQRGLHVRFVPLADIAQAGPRKRPPTVESLRFANVVIGTSNVVIGTSVRVANTTARAPMTLHILLMFKMV
jgi:hypothetical protein